jgi:hypothetical protein
LPQLVVRHKRYSDIGRTGLSRDHNRNPVRAPRSLAIETGADNNDARVCDPHCDDRDIDEREANARLIAAGPELLEALQSASVDMDDALQVCHDARIWDNLGVSIAKARTAIAKATGNAA